MGYINKSGSTSDMAKGGQYDDPLNESSSVYGNISAEAANAAKVSAAAALVSETNAAGSATAASNSAIAADSSADDAAASAILAADNSRLTAGTVTTLSPSTPATINITGAAGSQVLGMGIPKGDTGNGVVSVTRTAGTGAAGTVDTYTVLFTDATTSTFYVTNGANGTSVSLKGSVATVGDLPAGAAVGDLYVVLATGNGWVWGGSAWSDAGPIQGPPGTTTWAGITDKPANLTYTDAAQTLSGKSIALGSNTITGTIAQFNTALTDGDFATGGGTATGTNTGDETTATIKTKLGISTLSGDNTGDQTLAGLGGQPLDADLTAIAALAGTSGNLKKTAANTWSLDTTDYATLQGLNEHAANQANPHVVTKGQLGLGNVDNTSDATKNAATATLTNKTLTTPVLSNPSYSGTTANGGTVTTIAINGGTIDGTAIGSTTPAAVSATTLSASGRQVWFGGTDYGSYLSTHVDPTNAPYPAGLAGYTLTFNTGPNSARVARLTIDAAGAVTIPGSLGVGGAPNTAVTNGVGATLDVGVYGLALARNFSNNLAYYGGGWKYPKGNNGTASWLLGGDPTKFILYTAPQCTGAVDSVAPSPAQALIIDATSGAVTIPGTLTVGPQSSGPNAGIFVSSGNNSSINFAATTEANYTASIEANYGNTSFQIKGGSGYRLITAEGYTQPNTLKFWNSDTLAMTIASGAVTIPGSLIMNTTSGRVYESLQSATGATVPAGGLGTNPEITFSQQELNISNFAAGDVSNQYSGFRKRIKITGTMGGSAFNGYHISLDVHSNTDANNGMFPAFVSAAVGTVSVTRSQSLYGGNFYGNLDAGCTGWYNVTGAEFNTDCKSNVGYKTGLQVISQNTDTGVGTVEAAVAIGAVTPTSGTNGYQNGILFTNQNSGNPIRTGGKLIATHGSATVDTGIDLTTYTFSSNSIAVPGMVVTPTGVVNAAGFGSGGSAYLQVGTAPSGTAVQAVSLGTTGMGIYYGSGAPTSSAPQGSLYLRSDGSSTTTRMYVNTNGSTGWAAVTTTS